MKREERKKRKKVKEIHINHDVWKKYRKGYMKHIKIRKNIYKFKRPKKIDPKEFEVPKWTTTGLK